MANYNVPTTTNRRHSIGNAIVYMEAYETPTTAGVTPTTDLGVIDSVTYSINGTVIDLTAGSPDMLLNRFQGADRVSFTLNGVHEWAVNTLYFGSGAGATSGTGSDETWKYGGDMTLQKMQAHILHQFNDGATLNLYFWNVVGNGVVEASFEKGGGDFNKYDLTFDALRATKDFCNTTLTVGQHLFQYSYVAAP